MKSPETSLARAHLVIEGRVQGVWYRGSARREACRLGLTGFARNLLDGRVEVVAEGEREKVERLVAWCHQGPPGAIVRGVQVTWEDAVGEFTDFAVLA